MPFQYNSITALYSSGWALQNQATYTPLDRDIILDMRADIDLLGELQNISGANWTNNHYNWTVGSTTALSTSPILHLSYITDLRTACQELYTDAGLGSPSWTISTANLKPLYAQGETATTSSSVLTQAGADFSQVTDTVTYVHIFSGTGVMPGAYKVNSHTGITLTLDTNPGNSATGDIKFRIILKGNYATYTDIRKKSLYTDIQTAIITLAEEIWIFIDDVNGNDTTGNGSNATPYKTWNKGVTVLNAAGSGNLFFYPGTYNMNLQPTTDNTKIRGSALGDVIMRHDLGGTNYIFSGIDNIRLDLLHFRRVYDGVSPQNRWANECADMTVTECLFSNSPATGSDSLQAYFRNCDNIDFIHCTFMGTDNTSDDRVSAGLQLQTYSNAAITDCAFLGFNYCVNFLSGANATVTDCGFYDFTGKYFGASPTEGGTIWTSDPKIADRAQGHLDSTSPYINQANDGYDIGGYKDGPYNYTASISDSITISDATVDTTTEPIDETIKITEDLSVANFNIDVAMFGGGLLTTTSTGVASYLTTGDILTPTSNANFEYNGAFIDLTFDNPAGNQMKVYIVEDDGVSDYTDAAWWVSHATYPAATTSLTYAIDCVLDAQISSYEFGNHYTFSTVSADGDNDQQADLAIKLRVHNVSKNIWSELVSITKTYYLNDFNKSMYYCGDNPRLVDDEYANHANYYSETFHTSQQKYTRPDGVLWSADNRRYAYNPAFKIKTLVQHSTAGSTGAQTHGDIYHFWKYRNWGTNHPITENSRWSRLMIYAGIFNNFRNWNNLSDHCFDNSSPLVLSQPYDDGTANSSDPVMSSSTSDIRYIRTQGIRLSDCTVHSSHQSAFVLMSNTETLCWGDWVGAHALLDPSDNTKIFFEQDDFPGAPTCTTNRFYFEVAEETPSTSEYLSHHQFVEMEFYCNTDSSGNYLYGELSAYKSYSGLSTTPSTSW